MDQRIRQKYCEILGISVSDSYNKTLLLKVYRKKAIKEHPDKHGNSDEATEKFREINNAYEALDKNDTKEIVCLKCDKICKPWEGFNREAQTEFCSGECYLNYNNNTNPQNNTQHNHRNNNNNNVYHQCFRGCYFTGNPYEEWEFKGQVFYFCGYTCLPNCGNCFRKVSKRAGQNIKINRNGIPFCSDYCYNSFKEKNNANHNERQQNYQQDRERENDYSQNNNSYSNQYEEDGEYHQSESCSFCDSPSQYYETKGNQKWNFCESCAQKKRGWTCGNCGTKGIPTKNNEWSSNSEGVFCSSNCHNEYLQKLRDRKKAEKEQEEQEYREEERTCSRCGSLNAAFITQDGKEKLCWQCAEEVKKEKKENESKEASSFSENEINNSNPVLSEEAKKKKEEDKKPVSTVNPLSSPVLEDKSKLINEIKQELAHQEQELEVDLNEVGLSPTKLVEETEKLTNQGEVENYKNNLTKKIQQKREQKLKIIKDQAIQTIQEKLKNQGIKLSPEYKDFETKINSLISAAKVAQLQEEILNHIDNQQQVKTAESEPPKKENGWTHKIAVGAVILGGAAGISWLIWKLLRTRK